MPILTYSNLKNKRIKFVDRFGKCITFDNGGEGGGGEENELKLWGIGSTRGQLPTIKAVRNRVYPRAAADDKCPLNMSPNLQKFTLICKSLYLDQFLGITI